MTGLPTIETLFGTEVHKLWSPKLDQDYKLSVWMPPSYATTTTAYPVVYLLDASLWFGMAWSTTLPLIWGNEVPEVILAGIGYYHQGFEDIEGNRNRDLTPTTIKDSPGTGGAAAFLSVLETELIPFVDASYRTVPTDRTIWGTSLSGLFVLYTFLEHPRLFQRYIATSPALDWDLQDFLQRIEAMADTDVDHSTKMFISIGSHESQSDHANLEMLEQAFVRKNLIGLKLESLILTNETHTSQGARGYVTGLRKVFS
jgi:uncharacterized protein